MNKHRHNRGDNQPQRQERGMTPSVQHVDEAAHIEVKESTSGEEEMTDSESTQEVPVQQPAPQPVPQPVQSSPAASSSQVSDFEMFMLDYVSRQTKTPAETAAKQYTLFQRLCGILKNPNMEAFRKDWNTFLRYVKKHSTDVFSVTRAFEVPHSWQGSQTEYTSFRRVVTLAIVTCDPATRASSLKDHINFDITVVTLGETERNNLSAFYNL